MDNALNGRETYSRAGKFRCPVQPLERPEQRAGEGHVETHAVVAHIEGALAISFGPPELDARLGARPGELDGIAEQVLQHDFQKPRIAACRQTAGDRKFNPDRKSTRLN